MVTHTVTETITAQQNQMLLNRGNTISDSKDKTGGEGHNPTEYRTL
jgi:hypothetical protein